MLSTSETTFWILNKSYIQFPISIYPLFPPPTLSISISVYGRLNFLSGSAEILTCFQHLGKHASLIFEHL